jgi:hypothetical protein
VTDKHPWVLREAELEMLDSDELKRQESHTVFVGGASFLFHPHLTDRCFQMTGDPSSQRRASDDPTWMLEALRYVDEAALIGSELVQAAECQRFGFHVDLELHRSELESKHRVGPSGAPQLVGEVWIDGAELVRRVSREVIERRRRHRSRSDNEPEEWRAKTVTEFWDYGIEVSIPRPEVTQAQRSTLDVFKWFAGGLWNRRRDYKREHDQ